jgi:hypothetical protein
MNEWISHDVLLRNSQAVADEGTCLQSVSSQLVG